MRRFESVLLKRALGVYWGSLAETGGTLIGLAGGKLMEFIAGAIELEESAHARQVWDYLQQKLSDMEGLCGYQWPSVGAPLGKVPSFVIITKMRGIILCDVVEDRVLETAKYGAQWKISAEGTWIVSRDIILSAFAREIRTRLGRNPHLCDPQTGELSVSVRSVLLLSQNQPQDVGTIFDPEDIWASVFYQETFAQEFERFFQALPTLELTDALLDSVVADLETTRVFRSADAPQASTSAEDEDLLSTLVRKSFDHSVKLDPMQRRIAIQLPDGPQRIRGLAGTGKTAVLALKAALAHKNYPEFKILYLFNTQTMYQQVTDWVNRYYREETGESINADNLHILHAWGGQGQEGLYYRTAREHGLKPLFFRHVKNRQDPLASVYRSLLELTHRRLHPKYDMVLIDEAQDLAPTVFEVIFCLTKEPKRIIWAYDEFQTMKDLKIREPEELFGLNEVGQPNVPNASLQGSYRGGVEKDFVLKNSHRNPRLTLMVAHGIGLGLYRRSGIIDVLDSAAAWEALGYNVVEPKTAKFQGGDTVIVERPAEYSHNRLELLLRERKRDDLELISTRVVDSFQEECAAVADAVLGLVTHHKVPPEDVCVITLHTRVASEHLMALRDALDERGIRSISPGFVEKLAEFKVKGFVTLSTPFRAKGNEANFVFVMQAHRVYDDTTFRARNALFMAMTRSRGWTYLSGVGQSMQDLVEEIDAIKSYYPQFRFVYPNTVSKARYGLMSRPVE